MMVQLQIPHHRRVWQIGRACRYYRHTECRCCYGRPSAFLVLSSKKDADALPFHIPTVFENIFNSFNARRGTDDKTYIVLKR